LPGQPEIRSDQVVVLVVPDPSAGGSQAPLALLVPREEAGAPTPSGAILAAPEETTAAPVVAELPPAVEPAPTPSLDTTLAAPAAEPAPAVEPLAPATLPDAVAVEEPPAPAPDAGSATASADSEVAATAEAEPVDPEAAAAESAAAAVLDLSSLDEVPEETTAQPAGEQASGAADAAAAEGALDGMAAEGLAAEGLAAEALAALEPLPEVPAAEPAPPPITVAPQPLVEAAPVTPPVVEEAPQRTTGAGEDSASPQPLVVAAIPEQPPVRIGVEENTHRTEAMPVAAEPPATARNVAEVDPAMASVDPAVSRQAGPGADSAALPASETATAAVRPEVTENVTVTEIMIELKWSRPTVSTEVLVGDVVAAAPLTAVPETPASFRFGELAVLADMPAVPLRVELPILPPAQPPEPMLVAALPPDGTSLSDAVSISLASPPKLEPPSPVLAQFPERGVSPPQGQLLVIDSAPLTERFAALQALPAPAGWTDRPAALAELPLRASDAVIAAAWEIGGRAPAPNGTAGLDLLASASYQSTNPVGPSVGTSLQSSDAARAASALSPLDAAGYRSTTPGSGGGIGAAASDTANPSDSVDALIAEAQSTLDAATRTQQALDGAPTDAESAALPPVLPDGSSPAGALADLSLAEARPGDAGELSSERPLASSGDLQLPAELAGEAADRILLAALAEGAMAEQAMASADAGGVADLTADILAGAVAQGTASAAVEGQVPFRKIALASPHWVVETAPKPSELDLELGSFRRDEQLGVGAYEGLDSETLRGEGIRSGTVALQSVEYDDTGEVIIGGTATPNAPLNVYVDNIHVGSAVAGAEGEWKVMPNQPLSEGLHYLRVDQVEEGGRVVARVESPFARVEPIAVAEGDARVVVQPGNSLWRIARRTLGGGTRYTAIYEANRSQITDPDMIYPGQVFVVPAAQTTSNN
jgi:nucleoid-associated protein YgaU